MRDIQMLCKRQERVSKAEKLKIENSARMAINERFNCNSACAKKSLSGSGPKHEYDIYRENEIIGGVSTSPYLTSKGKCNTGGRDRAAAELLWLSLWQGKENRVHVLTCESMASWLYKRFGGSVFPFKITIFHFCPVKKQLREIGVLGA